MDQVSRPVFPTLVAVLVSLGEWDSGTVTADP